MASASDTFREHREPLVRYVYRMTGDARRAEDVVQTAFVRFLEQADSVERPRSWLFTVATNLVRDQKRKEKRRRELAAGESGSPGPTPPDEAAELRSDLEEVREALYRLDDRDRALLLLRAEGFSYREIADSLGLAKGSIGPMIGRALERLREEAGDVAAGSERRDTA